MSDQEQELTILLLNFKFDPLREKLNLPENLRIDQPQKAPAPFIVQFRKPLTREEQVHIKGQYGLNLTDYVPDGCFEDLSVSVIPGTWQVSAEYPGDECNAPQFEGPLTIPIGEQQEREVHEREVHERGKRTGKSDR